MTPRLIAPVEYLILAAVTGIGSVAALVCVDDAARTGYSAPEDQIRGVCRGYAGGLPINPTSGGGNVKRICPDGFGQP
jgi:hypothetical protein